MDESAGITALRFGAWANIVIGVGHIIAMARLREISEWVGGPGDRIAAIHPSLPYVLTFATALIFIGFGVYGLSACGDFRRLPFARYAVVGITWLYLIRAVGGSGAGGFIEDTGTKELAFSAIALAISILYAFGARSVFAQLGAES